MSGGTTVAVGGSMPVGLRFRSLGRHRLSGLPDAEALFQVEADGLLATFPPPRTGGRSRRSEEHTSELQSQSNLVCRLLLEKKKKIMHMNWLRWNFTDASPAAISASIDVLHRP